MGDLSEGLNQLLREVKLAVGKDVAEASIQLQDGLMSSTNVDTGRARSGWIVTDGEDIPSYVPPEKERRKADTPDGAYPEFIQEAEKNKANALKFLNKNSGTMRVTNNVEYINKIDTEYNPGFIDTEIERIK